MIDNNFDWIDDSDNEQNECLLQTRESAIVIFYCNDKISIITNTAEFKESEVEEHKQRIFTDNKNESADRIVDVNKLSKKLSIDKLKLLILNELNSDSEDIQIYSDIFDEKKEAIKSSQAINETEVNKFMVLTKERKVKNLQSCIEGN